MTDVGRSLDGSGYSAEPEPSSTVSAVPASIPNAEIDLRIDAWNRAKRDGASDRQAYALVEDAIQNWRLHSC